MLIDLATVKAKHNLNIRGVIHVGAHIGQEFESYMTCQIQHVAFFEPCTPAFQLLQKKFETNRVDLGFSEVDVKLFQLALGSYQGQALMNVETANEGQSNSLFKPKEHLRHYPSIQFEEKELVKIMELHNVTDLDFPQYNMMNMDVQGYELEVLKGATKILPLIDYVYTEVNEQEMYEGCAKLTDMDAFLSDFERVELKMTDAGWGDALYIRKKPAAYSPTLPQKEQESDENISVGVSNYVNGMIVQDENVIDFGQGVSVALDRTRYVMLAMQMDARLAKSLAAYQKADTKFWERAKQVQDFVDTLRSIFYDESSGGDLFFKVAFNELDKQKLNTILQAHETLFGFERNTEEDES